MQEMTKDEQIAVMQAKIDEMTSAILRKTAKLRNCGKQQPIGTLWSRSVYSFVPIKSGCGRQNEKRVKHFEQKKKSLANYRRCTVINASLYGSLEHRWQRIKSGITALGTRSWRGK